MPGAPDGLRDSRPQVPDDRLGRRQIAQRRQADDQGIKRVRGFGQLIALVLDTDQPGIVRATVLHLIASTLTVAVRGHRRWSRRVVDNEGEVLNFLVKPYQIARAALRLMRK